MKAPGLLLHLDQALLGKMSLFRGGSRNLPARIDERDRCLPTSNQRDTPECAAFATCGKIEELRWRWNEVYEQIDPHPLYLESKKIDGAPDEDGTTLTAVIQAAENLKLLPPIRNIRAIESVDALKAALHRWGPTIVGMEITSNLAKASSDGWVKEGGTILGGHAMLFVAYNDLEGWLGFQNSWGPEVGHAGFVRMSDALARNWFRYGVLWDYEQPRWI